jgi:murein DD-endopeptidase MepM/ murein hydrolase activator NlpD
MRVAQEFEAMLMTQMLREMRQSMVSEENPEYGLGNDVMTDTVNIELGRALSQAGGFGLVKTLSRALEERLGDPGILLNPSGDMAFEPPGALAAPTVPGPVIRTPMVDANPDGHLTLPQGPVTSPFGWRHDPFTGEMQFHRGIDIAQSYGQDVRAAAAGRVAFAGEQGSYGMTVVVDHGTGQGTRYAHLLAADVKAGDQVDVGQVIGRVGTSGRTTGPHLHFEVTTDGHATDPADLD